MAANSELELSQLLQAGRLWNEGKDTATIARALGVHESRVYNSLESIKRAGAWASKPRTMVNGVPRVTTD